MKNKFEIENVSGEKPIIIEQDFHATILLSNIASLFEQEAEEELQKENRIETLKYDVYRINKNILVGKLKNRFIEIMLEKSQRKKKRLFKQLIDELKRNIVPVIPDRSFKRTIPKVANRFANNKRRGL